MVSNHGRRARSAILAVSKAVAHHTEQNTASAEWVAGSVPAPLRVLGADESATGVRRGRRRRGDRRRPDHKDERAVIAQLVS